MTTTTARRGTPRNSTQTTSAAYTRKRGIPVTELVVRQAAVKRQEAYERITASGTVPASIWSFESLFPLPVLDTESIQKVLSYCSSHNRNGTTVNNNIGATPKGATADIADITDTADTSLLAVVVDKAASAVSQRKMKSSLYGGSAMMMRMWRDPKQQLLSTSPVTSSSSAVATAVSNNNTAAELLQQQQQQQQQASTTVSGSPPTVVSSTLLRNNNKNSNKNETTLTGKVDPLLTQMVEDRVYGYRQLPTGDLQYETSLLADGAAVQFREGVRLGNPLPVNADVLTYLAKKELQHGRVEESAELYERAVTTDPADGRAYLGLSKCAERRRDFLLARKWLLQGVPRSVSMNGPIPDRGANPFLLQALGCLEEKLGHLAQAEALYEEATRSRPCHAAAWVSLAVLRTRKLGCPVSAGRLCYQAAERELRANGKPASAHVYTSWANLEYHKAGDKTRARELFQKALKIDPKCSAAWLQLGVLEAACSNWEQAETCFETVLKFDQRNSRVLQAYALMETKRPAGDSRKAIGLFERALQANPRDAGVLQPYALYVAELGDLESARNLLRRGTEVNKRHAAVWQAWGVLEARYGDATAARKIFQEGIWACGQLTGGQSGGYHCDRLWQAWGVLEAKEGQHAAARRCFSRALDANGRNVPAFTAWALMEEQLGSVKDARMIFERALHKFSPGSDDKMALWRSYEVMEQRLGNVEAAQNVYQRSVRETFAMKDETEIMASGSQSKVPDLNLLLNDDGTKKAAKKSEFEVVRWESTGGEVWMNERAIETKVPMKNQQRGKKQP